MPQPATPTEASMVSYPSNLVTGRQLRAARVLAGLTQRTLGQALGIDERRDRHERTTDGSGPPN